MKAKNVSSVWKNMSCAREIWSCVLVVVRSIVAVYSLSTILTHLWFSRSSSFRLLLTRMIETSSFKIQSAFESSSLPIIQCSNLPTLNCAGGEEPAEHATCGPGQ